MTNDLYKKIVNSFHVWENEDFEAICGMIDNLKAKQWSNKETGYNVAIVSDYPYLLFLIFASLIRYYGIRIHLVNPLEGEQEVERLISSINPDYVIVTDHKWKDVARSTGYRTLLLDGEEINKFQDDDEYTSPHEPEELEFNVVQYTPFPTKVHVISCEMYRTMLDALINDLYSFQLVGLTDHGLIPFISTNSDYLLYFLAVKLANFETGIPFKRILPCSNEVDFPILNKKEYFKHNQSKTLVIPKKEFVELWEKHVSSLFECKFIFRSHLKGRWFVNMLIKRKLKKLFQGFKNVLIIGMLGNAFMVDILKNLSFTKFHTVFPIPEAHLYGPISNTIDSLTLASNEHRQDIPKELLNAGSFKGNPICSMVYRLYHKDNEVNYTLLDKNNRFVIARSSYENGELRRHLFYLGNVENAIDKRTDFIFPETLERVINSYPFIRSSVLLAFKKKMVLVINPGRDILTANRINWGMFKSIIWQQIETLNKELPESYKIQGFVIDTNLLIEYDRVGEIVRWPFNNCNKLSG